MLVAGAQGRARALQAPPSWAPERLDRRYFRAFEGAPEASSNFVSPANPPRDGDMAGLWGFVEVGGGLWG